MVSLSFLDDSLCVKFKYYIHKTFCLVWLMANKPLSLMQNTYPVKKVYLRFWSLLVSENLALIRELMHFQQHPSVSVLLGINSYR